MPTAKYQIRLLNIAEEDFTELISFIAADNPIAANAIASHTKIPACNYKIY